MNGAFISYEALAGADITSHGSMAGSLRHQRATPWHCVRSRRCQAENFPAQVYQEWPDAPPDLEVVVTRNGPSASRDARSRYERRRFSAYYAGRNDPGRSRLVRG